MKTIWKYSLRPVSDEAVSMPAGAVPLSVQEQNGKITLWAEVDDERAQVRRRVYFVGTGHEFRAPDSAEYVGTVLTFGGALVWHVYIDSDSPF